MPDYQKKLQSLRALMAARGLDAYIVPRTDRYLGEYIPACAERLAWLTGFTGSAGMSVVTAERAVAMSDGRYTLQLAGQVDASLYELADSQQVQVKDWLDDALEKGAVIGFDPKLHTPAFLQKLSDFTLKPVEENLVDLLWEDRPLPPSQPVSLFPEEVAGYRREHKIVQIRAKMAEGGCDAAILTMSDSIAWLLNIRGRDLPFIPVALSYLILPREGKAQWFINEAKVTPDVRRALESSVDFQPEERIEQALKNLHGQTVWYDPKRTSFYFGHTLTQAGAVLHEADDPVIILRACKTAAEIKAMKDAHHKDAAALVRFLHWFEAEAPKETLDELKIEAKLEEFRRADPAFVEPSFSTIAGYGPNGAIVHYRADETSNLPVRKGNFLLLDSGAQYHYGTTDITRTLPVGDVTPVMKKAYTLVLKAHIAVASAHFDEGTIGKEIDALARAPLQAEGMNYAHGTGHGVGCYLSVHEEAASLSPRGEEPLRAGMVLSNEPGYYEAGQFGIRIENLELLRQVDEGTLGFEPLTLVPISKAPLEPGLMSKEEIAWLNAYHEKVYAAIAPLVDGAAAQWLNQACAAL
jgi:Xaa-Pro aminopeptidase